MNLKYQSPSFMCIGPEKTGTTWLYHTLIKHPEVYLPPVKELRYFWEKVFQPDHNLLKRFFSKHWHCRFYQQHLRERSLFYAQNFKKLIGKDSEIKEQWAWDLNYLFGSHDDQWYLSLFKDGAGKTIGDIDPLCYLLPESEISRISKLFPELKVIVLIRNPIDRSWSKAKMNLCRNRNLKFEEVPDREFYEHFDDEFSCLSSYTNLVSTWQKYFPAENIHVNFYDKLSEEPITFLSEICDFVGLDLNSMPQETLDKLSQRVFKGLDINIPQEYADYLVKLYQDCIAEVATFDEVYPQKWVEAVAK